MWIVHSLCLCAMLHTIQIKWNEWEEMQGKSVLVHWTHLYMNGMYVHSIAPSFGSTTKYEGMKMEYFIQELPTANSRNVIVIVIWVLSMCYGLWMSVRFRYFVLSLNGLVDGSGGRLCVTHIQIKGITIEKNSFNFYPFLHLLSVKSSMDSIEGLHYMT